MTTCAVTNCTSSSNGDGKVRFHKFPSNTNELGLWLDFCESKGKLNLENSLICSKHFKIQDYVMVPSIKKGVIPTQFEPHQCAKLLKKKVGQRRQFKDDGSVTLPRMTKSGRMVVTPAAYKDPPDDNQKKSIKDEEDEEEGDDEDDENDDDNNVPFNDEEILKEIAETSELMVMTGEDLPEEDEDSPLLKKLLLGSSKSDCSCCVEKVKIEREARKIFQDKLEKEKRKQKEEKKRRKHLEKLLGASMQKQKATELRAQVVEEALKIYCPTHFMTGSSSNEWGLSTSEPQDRPNKKIKSEKGRWSWKKPSNSAIDFYKKSVRRSGLEKKRNVLKPLGSITSVELIEPSSPSTLGLDHEDTTVILVQEDSDTPIVSFHSHQKSPNKKKLMEDDDFIISNIESNDSGIPANINSINGDYKCTDCPFRSVFKAEFAAHTRKHLGGKRFVCSVCPFSSEQKTVLMEHMASHRNIDVSLSKSRVFKCSQCSYQTTDKSRIIDHERSHFDEKVKMKITSSMNHNNVIINHSNNTDQLTETMETNNEKVHYCDNCEFSAPHRASLIVHCTFNCPASTN